MTAKFVVFAGETQDKLPPLYWFPKLHKRPFKSRLIANSSSCTSTELSKLLASCLTTIKVRLKAKIRNRYNQIQHLTQDTIWKSDKNTRKHHTQKDQDVSPFPAGDHKAARNRQDSMKDMKHK